MKATKPQPGQTNAPPSPTGAAMIYRGKPHRVPTLAEIARHCRLMVWELDPDAKTVH